MAAHGPMSMRGRVLAQNRCFRHSYGLDIRHAALHGDTAWLRVLLQWHMWAAEAQPRPPVIFSAVLIMQCAPMYVCEDLSVFCIVQGSDGPAGTTASRCMHLYSSTYFKIDKQVYMLHMYPYSADMEGHLSCFYIILMQMLVNHVVFIAKSRNLSVDQLSPPGRWS